MSLSFNVFNNPTIIRIGHKQMQCLSCRNIPPWMIGDYANQRRYRWMKLTIGDLIDVFFLQLIDFFHFWQCYVEREQGKVVIYTTSMGVVRQTYQRCLQVQRILDTLLVAYEERDVSMNRQVQVRPFCCLFSFQYLYSV